MEGAIIPSAGAQLAPAGGLDFGLFGEWERFIDASPQTVRLYTANVRRFADYLSAQGITAPTRDTVLSYRKYLQARLKPATVASYLASLRVFFAWTESLAPPQYYPDITRRVKSPKISRDHKRDDLKPGECAEVLRRINRDTLHGARDYAILATMITCGFRDIEVTRADVGDVDERTGRARLYVWGKDRAGKEDYVNLPREALDAIRAYLQLREREEGRKLENSAPLFTSVSPNNYGGRLTTRSISRICKTALKDAGFISSRLSGHSFRHAAVSNALRGGEDIRAVQMFARHRNVSTTLIYDHSLSLESNTCSETISRLVFREGEEARSSQ